jgi:hypothetical protein
MKKINILFLLVLVFALLSGCSTSTMTRKGANPIMGLSKDDFEISSQVTGEATVEKILMVDWARLFNKKYGTIEVPSMAVFSIIGQQATFYPQLYAIYNILQENPGYDVVLYPQYETKKTGFIPFYSVTKVKVTTRLAKLKQ